MEEILERDREFRNEVRESLKEIRADVKMLIGFRAWLMGVGVAAGAIGGWLFNLIK